jgi:hypothetical protein
MFDCYKVNVQFLYFLYNITIQVVTEKQFSALERFKQTGFS